QILNNTFSGTQVRYGFIEAMFDNSLIQGNTITISGGGTTTDHGIYLHNGNNNTVRGNTVSGAAGYDIHVYDERKHTTDPQTFFNNVVIENNVLSNSQTHAGLIVSQGGDTQVNSVIVRNNVIYGNYDAGIDLTDYGSLPENGVKVYNNTIIGKITIGYPQLLSGAEIRNNIITGGVDA